MFCRSGGMISPTSPSVQVTSVTPAPSAAYLAIVAPVPIDSSSGCACTSSKLRLSPLASAIGAPPVPPAPRSRLPAGHGLARRRVATDMGAMQEVGVRGSVRWRVSRLACQLGPDAFRGAGPGAVVPPPPGGKGLDYVQAPAGLRVVRRLARRRRAGCLIPDLSANARSVHAEDHLNHEQPAVAAGAVVAGGGVDAVGDELRHDKPGRLTQVSQPPDRQHRL